MGALATLLLLAAIITASILVLIFVLVPLLKGVGSLIGYTFSGIGWLIRHIFEFIAGVLGDAVRFVGAIIAMVVLLPLAPLNVILGRWSAAGHFAESIKRECKVACRCVYRIALQRPLRFVLLHGLLEGLEERVPEAMAAAPARERPPRRVGQFDGYTIVGSLPGGGSGAKLYIAEPEPTLRDRGMPERVVIKSFTLTEGSNLPQIVRESRALEAARQLGLVLDHGMSEERFFYIMPYHPGDHLGIITRQLHGESGGRGLDATHLRLVTGFIEDLLATLATYHRGGLWHKDVKPENVIVHDGRAHLVDLGLVTPLRSAMTLTTHGTEYFRDPEMVRQALRGVKVHQVDGAKFDLYAVGAVLYFMLENTFPAHGGLSTFTRRSPEALRWIVRRSMTDYDKRYESADAMLRDLQAVATAPDMFALRPADLPSMTRGGDAGPAPEAVASVSPVAGTPMPPPPPDTPQGAAEAAAAAAAGAAAGAAAAAAAAAEVAAARSARPRIRVTNWWTGRYELDDEHAGGVPADAALQQEARALRHQVQHMRHQVRSGAMSARRAAREQVRAARERAREMRRRTARGRSKAARAPAERQPSAFLGFLIIVILVVGAIFAFRQVNRQRPGGLALRVPAEVSVGMARATAEPGTVLLVVDTPPALRSDHLAEHRINDIVCEYEDRGYRVVVDADAQEDVKDILADWFASHDGPAATALEHALAAKNVGGLLYVCESGDLPGPAHERLTGNLIALAGGGVAATASAEAPTAVVGREELTIPPPRALPLLLVNDHPGSADSRVMRRVQEVVDAYERHGWEVLVDDEAEAAVRKALPAGALDAATDLSPLLQLVLSQHELGGVLLIGAGPGDGSPVERTVIRQIDALPLSQIDDGRDGAVETVTSSGGGSS